MLANMVGIFLYHFVTTEEAKYQILKIEVSTQEMRKRI